MLFDKVKHYKYLKTRFEKEYVMGGKSKHIRIILDKFYEYIDSTNIHSYNQLINKLIDLNNNSKLLRYSYETIHRVLVNVLKGLYKQDRDTLKDSLPKGAILIYQCVTGSQSFNLATETSDIDIKGIYIQPFIHHTLLDKSESYVPTTVVGKDENYFEIKRFIELISKGDASALDMLFSPRGIITHITPEMKYLRSYKSDFVTKQLYYTYYNFAIAQFKKGTNYNRMANWEEERKTRQDVSSFCKFMDRTTGKTHSFKDWLLENNINDEDISLTKMDGFPNGFRVYNYKANIWYTEKSNELRTSKIPKEMNNEWIGTIHFNHQDYSKHCKDYKKYLDWLDKRNEERYNVNNEHAQKFDSKNIMHTIRLLMVSLLIPTTKTIKIDMFDNRDYLLKVKHGLVDLQTELDVWLGKTENIKELFDESGLPDSVDMDKVNSILYNIRLYTQVRNKKVLAKI